MDVKYAKIPAAEAGIVYVRAVAVSELPQDVQEEIGGLATVYSVNLADGERVALVADRKMAFALARQNEMRPVAVH